MGKFTLDYGAYAELSEKVAAEGCVLLENREQALPLKKGEKVALFGRIAYDYFKSGTGSGGMVNAPYVTTIPQGLEACGIRLWGKLDGIYKDWMKENPFDKGNGWGTEPWCQKEMVFDAALAKEAAEENDAAVIVIGRTAGEDRDNHEGEGSYLLSQDEADMIRKVCAAFKRSIVVLNVGNIIDMSWVKECSPSAVLYVWQGGQEGGKAAAKVLTGEINPSGKMADTIPESLADHPAAAHFGRADYNLYAEDIYVGYRYFTTFAPEKALYPFGYGLSYTTFEVKGEAGRSADGVELKVKVTNTGSVCGREVVQIYVEKPQGRLGQPLRSLAAFDKTDLLEPGQSQEICIRIAEKDLASYDDSGKTGYRSAWVLEEGVYRFLLGGDSLSCREIGVLSVDRTRKILELEEACAPMRTYERLLPEKTEEGMKVSYETVPVRTISLKERMENRRPQTLPFTGDQGYKLADVQTGRISMDTFLMQLSDEELAQLTRGEGMCSVKVTAGTAGAFGGLSKTLLYYGIPAGCCSDGPSGIRMDSGTMAFSLPSGTCQACSFDTELVRRLYEYEGLELRYHKIDTLLGPGINIHRHPLNGRNFEYFSEDPLLTGKMAAAQLQGMHTVGVTGTIKHYACNNQETYRTEVDSVISERALREIYLKAYEIAVKEGNARSIMSTYGGVNGTWTAGNYDLLTTIPRGEWGFNGMIMTDWWAKISDDQGEGDRTNTPAMLRGQNDLYMVVENSEENSMGDHTMEAIADGSLTRGELMRSAANVCRFLLQSPALERLCHGEDTWEVLNLPEDQMDQVPCIARLTVEEEAVLPTEGLRTGAGEGGYYDLELNETGWFEVEMTACGEGTKEAQIPVNVYMNNHYFDTMSFNGGGEVMTLKTTSYRAMNRTCYLKLGFVQGGLEVKTLRIRKITVE